MRETYENSKVAFTEIGKLVAELPELQDMKLWNSDGFKDRNRAIPKAAYRMRGHWGRSTTSSGTTRSSRISLTSCGGRGDFEEIKDRISGLEAALRDGAEKR